MVSELRVALESCLGAFGTKCLSKVDKGVKELDGAVSVMTPLLLPLSMFLLGGGGRLVVDVHVY